MIIIAAFRLTLVLASAVFNAGNITLNFAHISEPPLNQESFSLAKTFIGRAVQLSPASPYIWRSYGYANLMNGEVTEAIKAWRQSNLMPYEMAFYCERTFENQQFNETLSWIDYGIQVAPEYGDWFYYWGLVLKESNEADQALSTLLQSLKWPLLTLSKSDIYFQIGLLHQQTDTPDLEQSLDALNKAIEIADFSRSQYEINAHFERGEILRRLGDGDQAISEYEWVLDNQPSDYWSHIALGTLYWHIKSDFVESEQFFLRAISLRPDVKRAYERLGQLYAEHGHIVNAIEVYQKILLIDPNNQFAIDQIQTLTKTRE